MANIRYVVFLKGSPYMLDEEDDLEQAYKFIERREQNKKLYYVDFVMDNYEIVCVKK